MVIPPVLAGKTDNRLSLNHVASVLIRSLMKLFLIYQRRFQSLAILLVVSCYYFCTQSVGVSEAQVVTEPALPRPVL
jgi:hypothetical protein